MPHGLTPNHQRRQTTSRMYILALVALTIAVIVFAVVLVRSTSPTQGPVNSLTHGLGS